MATVFQAVFILARSKPITSSANPEHPEAPMWSQQPLSRAATGGVAFLGR